MAHAEKCPICNGVGKINETGSWSTTGTTSFIKTCNGCDGKGWVTVDDPGDCIFSLKEEE